MHRSFQRSLHPAEGIRQSWYVTGKEKQHQHRYQYQQEILYPQQTSVPMWFCMKNRMNCGYVPHPDQYNHKTLQKRERKGNNSLLVDKIPTTISLSNFRPYCIAYHYHWLWRCGTVCAIKKMSWSCLFARPCKSCLPFMTVFLGIILIRPKQNQVNSGFLHKLRDINGIFSK